MLAVHEDLTEAMNVAFKQEKDMRRSLHDSPGIGGLPRYARRQAVGFRIVLRLSGRHDLLAGLGERNRLPADRRRLSAAPASSLRYGSGRVAPDGRHARGEVAHRAAAIPDSRQVHFAVGEMRRRSHRSPAAAPSAALRGIRIRAASGGSGRLRGSQGSGRLRQERDHAERSKRPERQCEKSFHKRASAEYWYILCCSRRQAAGSANSANSALPSSVEAVWGAATSGVGRTSWSARVLLVS